MLYSITNAQKKSNGTIYIKHPAIDVVEAMTKAFTAGDANKVASYLTNDFKSFNGLNINDKSKNQDKASFSKSAKLWFDALDDFAIVPSEGSYPDALEYKEDNQKDLVWVLTWGIIKGVYKKTGEKVDIPMHRMFIVTKDNKIKNIITYLSSSIENEIGLGMTDIKNSLLYNSQ